MWSLERGFKPRYFQRVSWFGCPYAGVDIEVLLLFERLGKTFSYFPCILNKLYG
jgi:hypothetical protein